MGELAHFDCILARGGHAMKKEIIIWMLAGMVLLAGCNSDKNGEIIGEVVNNTEIVLSTEIPEMDVAEIAATEEDLLNRLVYGGASYTWEEISVTIPEEWKDKFVIKEDGNGFSIYQIASQEVDVALGLLCGVYRSEQYSNVGAGETLMAYTDDGVLYYMVQPTDVNCYMEDEAVTAEYMNMMSYVDWIAGSIQIEGDNVHYDANQYEIPVSSIMPLEKDHLVNLTNNELWIARNEIYARHGKIFKNEYLNSYFNSCSWYEAKEGKNEIDERELNEVEILNLSLIISAEKAYAIEHPYPKKVEIGEEAQDTLFGTEGVQIVRYEVNMDENGEYTCLLTIDGNIYNVAEYAAILTPIEDVYFLTDISEYDERIEIAVLDNGPSDDPVTHFFQYDGELHYVGEVQGFPFDDYSNNDLDGFSGQNSVMGTGMVDLIESAYVDAYYWYDSQKHQLEKMDLGSYSYRWFEAHELFTDIPLYYTRDVKSPTRTLKAQKEVFFIATDCKEWILVRGKDGTEGYIHIKDGKITNIGLPAEDVFSELYFFG